MGSELPHIQPAPPPTLVVRIAESDRCDFADSALTIQLKPSETARDTSITLGRHGSPGWTRFGRRRPPSVTVQTAYLAVILYGGGERVNLVERFRGAVLEKVLA